MLGFRLKSQDIIVAQNGKDITKEFQRIKQEYRRLRGIRHKPHGYSVLSDVDGAQKA